MSEDVEDVDSFRERARAWVLEELPLLDDDRESDVELQRRLFDGGFAGIAMPRRFGGAGLTLRHQQVFYDEAAASRRVPTEFSTSIAILGATLLDEGGQALVERHLPRILRGDERWIQLLSEPSAGSDLAGVLTRLTRDGDLYLLDGAKMWSTGATEADWGMCLARTDFSLPKHKGLSMVAVPLKGAKGVTINRIRRANGEDGEFCQEFFDGVELSLDCLIGEENGGWKVARTLIGHERLAAGGSGHGYGLSWRSGGEGGLASARPSALLASAGIRRSTAGLRHLVADAYIERTVAGHATRRITTGIRTGKLPGTWGSVLKLHLGMNSSRESRIALAANGADGVIWEGTEHCVGSAGEDWLVSRGPALGGGSNEMQRNLVSEQILGLPREQLPDKNVPFGDLVQNRRSSAG